MQRLNVAIPALLSAIAALLLSACGGNAGGAPLDLPANGTAAALPHHRTFRYTGARQSFRVPAGVTHLVAILCGAAGAGETTSYGQRYFGLGGRVYAIVPVELGERLYVYVGGRGTGTGGFNGGGVPGSTQSGFGFYGGGGASDIREGGDDRNDRILVAGGGGGQGAGSTDGFGGNGGGALGGMGGGYSSEGLGGDGGSQSQGGAGGKGGQDTYSGYPGSAGRLGRGGSGGDGGSNPSPSGHNDGGGGGGGGGYYGGGGGGGGGAAYASIYGEPGGGGDGSSYVEARAMKFRSWQGWDTATGNGLVVLSWS